jgi:2-pyrone-4,6-dicarboxylate lactonase
MMMTEPLVSEPMLDLAGNTPPGFAVPKGACDAHMHVFGPQALYPRVPDPHYTLPDGDLDHFRKVMTRLHLDRFVIVQPSYYGTDNACLIDNLKRSGKAGRGVVMIEDDTPRATLEAFHAAGVRGIRLDLFKRRALPIAQIRTYIDRMAGVAKALGWHLQFYAPGYVVRDLIDYLADVETPHVIDHMGYMLAEDGLTPADFNRLVALMQHGQTYIKLSGPYRIAKTRGYAPVADVAKAIVQAGSHKAMWGSDWPHIPHSGRDTGELLNLLAEWAPDAGDRANILVHVPQTLFSFDT